MTLFTCETSPWSRSPLRSDWTCRWWSWAPGWAIRSLPDRIVSLKTTSSGETPQTCEQVVVLLLHLVAQNNRPPYPETPPAAALHACAVNYRCVEECEETQTDLVDRIILARRVLFSSRLNCMTPGVSNFCLIHWHCSTSLMNINSTPMCWQ